MTQIADARTASPNATRTASPHSSPAMKYPVNVSAGPRRVDDLDLLRGHPQRRAVGPRIAKALGPESQDEVRRGETRVQGTENGLRIRLPGESGSLDLVEEEIVDIGQGKIEEVFRDRRWVEEDGEPLTRGLGEGVVHLARLVLEEDRVPLSPASQEAVDVGAAQVVVRPAQEDDAVLPVGANLDDGPPRRDLSLQNAGNVDPGGFQPFHEETTVPAYFAGEADLGARAGEGDGLVVPLPPRVPRVG